MRLTRYNLHKWTGLVASLLLLSSALSGLALAFRWELTQAVDPAGARRQTANDVRDADLDRVEATLRRAVPGGSIHRLTFPRIEGGTYLAQMVQPDGAVRFASVDPGDASLLRVGSIWRFPLELLAQWHFHLLAGAPGLAVVGTAGLLLIFLLVTGLQMWWPSRRGIARAFRVRWEAPARQLLPNLHRIGGAVSALLLGTVAVTGVLLAFVPLLAGGALDPAFRAQHASGRLQAAFEVAQRKFPGRGVHDVRFPADGSVVVLFRAPEVGPRAVHIIQVHPADLTIGRMLPAEAQGGIAAFSLPLHPGERFGTTGLVLELITGTVLLLLVVTGLSTWLLRRAHLARRRAEAAAAVGIAHSSVAATRGTSRI